MKETIIYKNHSIVGIYTIYDEDTNKPTDVYFVFRNNYLLAAFRTIEHAKEGIDNGLPIPITDDIPFPDEEDAE